MSWFSRFTERIRRIFRRRTPELEIPVEQPEVEVTPPITPEAEQPFIPEEEKEEVVLPPEFEEAEIPAEGIIVKKVTFIERDRNTRKVYMVTRIYPANKSNSEINHELAIQYDNGGNYVIGEEAKDIVITKGSEGEEDIREYITTSGEGYSF
jgi:hypothetical protein